MRPQASGENERGLRLLSIDGGGIRGLSPLIMLKEIMFRIQQKNKLDELPRPCDVFDLAGGTSTGGLIVIMLFRLQMTIDEAIEAYAKLAKSVFSERKWFWKQSTFKASRLEDAILSVIRPRLVKSDGDPQGVKMSYQDSNSEGSKCFVCAVPKKNMAFPILFRSWTPERGLPVDCTILQAARATTAAPTFFKAAEFGHPISQQYVDGGILCNNPVEHVLQQAESLYPNRSLSCILSLGTGTREVIGLGKRNFIQKILPLKIRLIKVLKDIATDCEGRSEAMARNLSDTPNLYFRLNVNSGLQDVSLEEWDRLNDVQGHTLQYLRQFTVGQNVDKVVKILQPSLVSDQHSANALKGIEIAVAGPSSRSNPD